MRRLMRPSNWILLHRAAWRDALPQASTHRRMLIATLVSTLALCGPRTVLASRRSATASATFMARSGRRWRRQTSAPVRGRDRVARRPCAWWRRCRSPPHGGGSEPSPAPCGTASFAPSCVLLLVRPRRGWGMRSHQFPNRDHRTGVTTLKSALPHRPRF